MDDVTIPGKSDPQYQYVLAQFGGPAFLRRAQRAEGALADLLQRLRTTRWQWLDMVRLRLGQLHALAGGWPPLARLIGIDSLTVGNGSRIASQQKRSPKRAVKARFGLRFFGLSDSAAKTASLSINAKRAFCSSAPTVLILGKVRLALAARRASRHKDPLRPGGGEEAVDCL